MHPRVISFSARPVTEPGFQECTVLSTFRNGIYQ